MSLTEEGRGRGRYDSSSYRFSATLLIDGAPFEGRQGVYRLTHPALRCDCSTCKSPPYKGHGDCATLFRSVEIDIARSLDEFAWKGKIKQGQIWLDFIVTRVVKCEDKVLALDLRASECVEALRETWGNPTIE